MTAAKTPPRLQSWIPPSFAWMSASGVFGLEVPISDPDVVEFVVTGSRDVTIIASKKHALAIAALIGTESLRGQLEAAVWDPKLLRPPGARLKNGTTVQAHCHGVFCLPGSRALLVLVGRTAPTLSDGWLSPALKAEAAALHAAHQVEVAEFEERIRRKKEESEQFHERYPDMERGKVVSDAFLAIEAQFQHPVLRADRLLALLPKATTFASPLVASAVTLDRRASAALAASAWPPSRDGNYEGILSLPVGRKSLALLSWVPYLGLPAYPEVRWSLQRRLPRALRDPRATQPGRPEFESGLRSMDDSTSINGIATDTTDLIEALEDIELDQSGYRDRVGESKKEASEHGFEANAWFQPYHVWSEETWGIYIDARKLDDLALSLLDDFKTHRVQGSHSLAALLAFGLTYAHELFHARVEAAVSWMEINAGQPRHLRYKQRVYDVLRETPEWLEEALANWSSWKWFKSPTIQDHLARQTNALEAFDRVVEASLDLSPPGYRDWRTGHDLATWRVLSTQLSSASPQLPTPGIGLPLDSALSGPLPYDLLPSDIPLRFVGRGVIADRLQSHPATFNVPTRRELEKALKYFKHIVDPSGGKGGHQKWTGPDQRAFILPTRDPVSVGVFKTFLQHLGIDKATYVREVRPNI